MPATIPHKLWGVWRRAADLKSAVRPRWRVSQTIRNRAEPRDFMTKEESDGQSAEVKVEVAGEAEPPSEAESAGWHAGVAGSAPQSRGDRCRQRNALGGGNS